MKPNILVLTSMFLWGSCLIQFVNTNYYNELDSESKRKIHKLESFNDLKEGVIYEITGSQLLNELKTKEKSLVYIFKNGFSSDNCLPLSTIQNYAEENELTAYLVMNSYYRLDHSLDQKFKGSLFSINADHYQSDKTKVYARKFKKDLGYYEFLDRENEKWLGSYYFFVNDSLVEIKKGLSL